jgi:lactoylglutathione lyase
MKFNHVTLSVKNIERSLSFYQDIVGLEIKRRFKINPETEILFLSSGDTEIELISGAFHSSTAEDKGISLGFISESLESTLKHLRDKGFDTDGNIISPNPQMSFFFAYDPDGYKIQFLNIKQRPE